MKKTQMLNIDGYRVAGGELLLPRPPTFAQHRLHRPKPGRPRHALWEPRADRDRTGLWGLLGLAGLLGLTGLGRRREDVRTYTDVRGRSRV